MNKNLATIGLKAASKRAACITLYCINNPDGSPRWFWNASNPNPDFLRFYSVSTLRSKIFSLAIELIFFFKLQHLFFRRGRIKVNRDNEHVLAQYTANNFALFTGTPGPNRKWILFAQNQFIKIGLNAHSEALVSKETKNLSLIKSEKLLEVPQAKSLAYGILSLTDFGKQQTRLSAFTSLHAAALNQIYGQSPMADMVFKNSAIFEETMANLNNLQGVATNKLPCNLLQKLGFLADSLANTHFIFGFAHRDFTPWNCFVSKEKLKLYDFELAHPELPFGFDAFHFVIQQGILVNRLPWKLIKPQLIDAFEMLCKVSRKKDLSFNAYLQAYFFINTAYYLLVYAKQATWHQQIHWLLHTWNDALSDLLPHKASQRALIINDVFDFLHNEPYAAIKLPNIPPNTLSENSDIDLLVLPKTANSLQIFLANHSLVKKVNIQTQSKMNSLLVVLHNDQVLALDLIWQLRVKSLEFMDVKLAINAAIKNDFGIKVLNQEFNQTYLRYFYGLNNSEIPAKYQTLFPDFVPNNYQRSLLQQELINKSANKGFAAIANNLLYLVDVVRQFLFQKGMVITFSGVDGAGKSTIIEHTKNELEKKLRKKVVVIRHRPSLLPILSALTQGKESAEQKAANSLPRQGTNKSFISSLLRFAYYYTDYVFGQFYVYAKHVSRGNIVLYDRYYFDFINDSLRSNIQLPKWLTKAGYKLLLKPHLNFFLYADTETILNRKKELDATAITYLTTAYLNLFAELNSKAKGRYFPIENLQLHTTVKFITSKTQAKIV